MTGELALDVGEHPAIGDRQRREVERDALRRSPAALARGGVPAEQRGDPADDEAVDLAYQPVALGGRQERAGRHEPPVRFVGESHERLVVGDAAAGETDDRLVVQHE